LKTLNQWLPLLISVIGATLSGATFYFVNISRGELDVFLPDKVAVAFRSNRLHVLVPLTLTNTGSTRSRRQVHKVVADVVSLAEQSKGSQKFTALWQYEVKFMDRLEYFKNYPDERARDTGEPDFLVYVNRALPFQLIGGAFVSKTYDFMQPVDCACDPVLGDFELAIMVHTESGEVRRAATYRLPTSARLVESYAWAVRVD
jgi:hypothetical protein